nr:DNA replication and repair protein RecF [Moraxella caprae]
MTTIINMSSCPCVCDGQGMITQLQITHVRNLAQISLTLADCNVFVGRNGSGKTSLLEAVFLLSRGKTFRHHEPKRYISHHQKSCTVWAMTGSDMLAVQKNLDERQLATTVLKLNGQTVTTQSPLTYALPVLPIDPSGMTVLEEGSHARRQMLDWLTFHVKQEFYGEWLAYQRLLKQRNLLLKSPRVRERAGEVRAWDNQLAYHADKLHQCRQAVFERWQVCFDEMMGRLLPHYQGDIYLSYQAGFDDKTGLLSILASRLGSDMELGYTRVGAHRADVMVMLKQSGDGGHIKSQAVDVLSRGEKKLLITALRLSQLQVMCAYQQIQPVVLVDDIDAELDVGAMNVLLGTLLSLPCQLMITSLQDETAEMVAQKLSALHESRTFKKFHVKQGDITPDECST